MCVCVFRYVLNLPHLQDAFLLALCYPFSCQAGEAVFADFVHLVAVVLKWHLVVRTLPAHHLRGAGKERIKSAFYLVNNCNFEPFSSINIISFI